MPAPKNPFKMALAKRQPQIGLWIGMANAITAELCAQCGFDWLVVDGEHAPNDIRSIIAQLQAMAASPSHAVVRTPIGEAWLIKQFLDLGAQTILVPMVETAEQAGAMVRAVRYPPKGVRGVAASLARASRYNTIADYLMTADDEICLLVQIESRRGLQNLETIAATDGVDGIFIGPSDLAADMGHLGKPGCAEVDEAVTDAIRRTTACGKAAGVLSSDRTLALKYLEAGATFLAIGSDVGVLSGALRSLRREFPA